MWTSAERRVVWRGWLGRLTIAIEPMIVGLFFAVLPIALVLRKLDFAVFVAPIFAFAAIAFVLYAIVLMVPCTKAIIETFSPIFIVDGYIRYRKSYPPQSPEPVFYVAVLNEDRRLLGEWPLREWPESIGDRELWPVLVEFSPYGGIHKIDGHPTGVLPTEIPSFGIGISAGDKRNNQDSNS